MDPVWLLLANATLAATSVKPYDSVLLLKRTARPLTLQITMILSSSLGRYAHEVPPTDA